MMAGFAFGWLVFLALSIAEFAYGSRRAAAICFGCSMAFALAFEVVRP